MYYLWLEYIKRLLIKTLEGLILYNFHIRAFEFYESEMERVEIKQKG